MPSGIILKSASHEESEEVRQQHTEAAIEAAGYEVEKPELETAEEPKRDDFKSKEEFEAAHVAWQDTQDEKEDEKEIEEEEKSAVPQKKSRKQRAVDRAVAEYKRKLDDALAENAALKGKNKPPEDNAPLVEPKEEDFADKTEYKKALIEWAFKNKANEDAKATAQKIFEENIKNYGAQVAEAKEKYEDWDEVVNKELFIGREVQLTILEQENAAEVSYYLGKHPAYAAKLGEMCKTPGRQLSAVREVERLSMRLLAEAPAHGESDPNDEEKPKPKPKVPAPVRTVSTGGSNAVLTFAEIAAKPNYPGKARDLRKAMAAGE